MIQHGNVILIKFISEIVYNFLCVSFICAALLESQCVIKYDLFEACLLTATSIIDFNIFIMLRLSL